MKHKHHKNQLKNRIKKIEKILDKMSRNISKKYFCEVKSLFKGWDGWWASIKEIIMARRGGKKPMASKKGGKRGGKKKRSKFY